MKKGRLSQYTKLRTCFECALHSKHGVNQGYNRDVLLNSNHKKIPYLSAQKDSCKDKQFWHVFDRIAARKKEFCAIAILSSNQTKIFPKMVKDIGKISDTKWRNYAFQSFHSHQCNVFALAPLIQRSCHTRANRSRNCNIVRPLLDFSRTVMTTICISQKIPVYPDNSNQSLLYSRNRIRKQIIPFIQLVLNPKMEEAVFRFAELAFQEQELTSKLCRQNNLCL